jgi:hypothetical protein
MNHDIERVTLGLTVASGQGDLVVADELMLPETAIGLE